jgi:hypothetical protein
LRVHVVPATSAGEAGQDRSRAAAAWIAHEEAVFAIKNDALHLSLRDVVVDADRSVGAEHAQFRPLAQGGVSGFCPAELACKGGVEKAGREHLWSAIL